MTTKFIHTWVTASAPLFPPSTECDFGGFLGKHPLKSPIFWGRCLENSRLHCTSVGGSQPKQLSEGPWKPSSGSSKFFLVATSTWGVSKHWELMTCQIYECFLYQQMFADSNSPELRFPLFPPSDLLIWADNGNSTFFHRQLAESKRRMEWKSKKNWCWWNNICH